MIKTKKQRLDIYIRMLERLNQSTHPSLMCYCYLLSRLLPTFIEIKDFPELMAYKPKTYYGNRKAGFYRHTRYWWSPHNYKKRIQVLEEIINNMKKS